MSQAFSGKIQMSPPQCLPWRWLAKQMVILQVPPRRAFQAASSHLRVSSQQDVPSPPPTPQEPESRHTAGRWLGRVTGRDASCCGPAGLPRACPGLPNDAVLATLRPCQADRGV